MLDPHKKKVSQAVFVIGYERDIAVRTKQFEIEKALSGLIGSASVNTNLPDDFNPSAPRVTLSNGRLSAQFSQIAAQLVINIDNGNGIPASTILASISKNVALFESALSKVIAPEGHKEKGVVLTVNYPADVKQYSTKDIFAFIHSRFLKVAPLGSPASATFSAGYKTQDNFYLTLSVAHYEIHEGKDIVITPGQWLDVMQWPIVDQGLELKVDFNSKPMLETQVRPQNVTETLLKKASEYVLKDADTFVGV